MIPEGKAFVLASSNARGGVPSAKKRFPVPAGPDRRSAGSNRQGLFEQRRCKRGAARKDKVWAVVRLNAL